MMPTLSHRQAVFTMMGAALLWSLAGVVARQLDSARSFEVTFWRSAFNAVALALMLSAWHGPGRVWAALRQGGRALWLSALCWCVMYTAFMLALTLTIVANILVTMALAPLITALLARVALGHRLTPRTWLAIGLAAVGIGWMYGAQFNTASPQHWLGTAVALAVPIASATNWVLIQHLNQPAARVTLSGQEPERHRQAQAAEMLYAVLLGALLSAALMLPLAWPLTSTAHDVGWLALLGVVQLAIPCLMAVVAARSLSAPEASLLALLEVVFGVSWAWLGAGEAPGVPVLGGGALVLLALAANELPALVRGRGAPVARA